MSNEFAYDAVTYPSMVFPHIRPDRLASIATLHGIDVPSIDNCRVLELGCGDGANLISIAYSMPNSDCLGVDLSVERIKDAEKITDELGLTNAKFQHADVMEFNSEKYGTFDFIIAHGLYSWVPDFVREKVLAIYRECLRPKGVGYISYNAYPGWHLRGYIRDAMRFQAELIEDSEQKVESALNFLRFIRESSVEGSLFRQFMDAEIESSEDRPTQNLFHDELADINQPFYFTEFVEQIERHDLRFFAESEPVSSFYRRFPEFTRQALEKLGDDYVRREQYVDFLKAKRFRSSLVCHKEAGSATQIDPDRLSNLLITSNSKLITENAVLHDNSPVTFQGPHESEMTLNHPMLKTTLVYLASKWPARVSYTDLERHLAETLPGMVADKETIGSFRGFLVELYKSTVIEVRSFDPSYVSTISDRPKVSDFVRWQARSGFDYVNGITGSSMKIQDGMARWLLLAADGTRTRQELIAQFEDFVSANNMEISFTAADFVNNNLPIFLGTGLLIE